ncbi:MAG TPA: hypothetical protein VMT73_02120 [Anaerolineales bacterium]|nr:hypothetical protein [Anaerolineales bacterium]
MLNKIINALSKWKTIHLVMLPVAIGLIPLVIFLLLGSAGYRGTSMQGLLLVFTFFIWGFMGLPMVIRKEMPWLIIFRGWIAIIEGVALMLVWWALAIIFIGIMLGAR